MCSFGYQMSKCVLYNRCSNNPGIFFFKPFMAQYECGLRNNRCFRLTIHIPVCSKYKKSMFQQILLYTDTSDFDLKLIAHGALCLSIF